MSVPIQAITDLISLLCDEEALLSSGGAPNISNPVVVRRIITVLEGLVEGKPFDPTHPIVVLEPIKPGFVKASAGEKIASPRSASLTPALSERKPRLRVASSRVISKEVLENSLKTVSGIRTPGRIKTSLNSAAKKPGTGPSVNLMLEKSLIDLVIKKTEDKSGRVTTLYGNPLFSATAALLSSPAAKPIEVPPPNPEPVALKEDQPTTALHVPPLTLPAEPTVPALQPKLQTKQPQPNIPSLPLSPRGREWTQPREEEMKSPRGTSPLASPRRHKPDKEAPPPSSSDRKEKADPTTPKDGADSPKNNQGAPTIPALTGPLPAPGPGSPTAIGPLSPTAAAGALSPRKRDGRKGSDAPKKKDSSENTPRKKKEKQNKKDKKSKEAAAAAESNSDTSAGDTPRQKDKEDKKEDSKKSKKMTDSGEVPLPEKEEKGEKRKKETIFNVLNPRGLLSGSRSGSGGVRSNRSASTDPTDPGTKPAESTLKNAAPNTIPTVEPLKPRRELPARPMSGLPLPPEPAVVVPPRAKLTRADTESEITPRRESKFGRSLTDPHLNERIAVEEAAAAAAAAASSTGPGMPIFLERVESAQPPGSPHAALITSDLSTTTTEEEKSEKSTQSISEQSSEQTPPTPAPVPVVAPKSPTPGRAREPTPTTDQLKDKKDNPASASFGFSRPKAGSMTNKGFLNSRAEGRKKVQEDPTPAASSVAQPDSSEKTAEGKGLKKQRAPMPLPDSKKEQPVVTAPPETDEKPNKPETTPTPAAPAEPTTSETAPTPASEPEKAAETPTVEKAQVTETQKNETSSSDTSTEASSTGFEFQERALPDLNTIESLKDLPPAGVVVSPRDESNVQVPDTSSEAPASPNSNIPPPPLPQPQKLNRRGGMFHVSQDEKGDYDFKEFASLSETINIEAFKAKKRTLTRTPAESPAQLEKRNYIAKEILTTEHNYYRDLCLIRDCFEIPLRKAEIIPTAQLDLIFPPSLTTITIISETLLKKLEQAINVNSQNYIVGEIFVEMSSVMNQYTAYINNYEVAVQTLNNLNRTEKKFTLFIRDAEKKPECRKHSLVDLLIIAIQRLPRYVLLLSDLFAATFPSHQDFLPLKEATTKMKGVANYVNTQKRLHQNKQRATQLFTELHLEDQIDAERQFIFEVQIWKELPTKKEDKNAFPMRKCFIFNDTIMINKTFGGEKATKISKFPTSTSSFAIPVNAQISRFRLNNKYFYVEDLKLLNKMIQAITIDLPELEIHKEEIDASTHSKKSKLTNIGSNIGNITSIAPPKIFSRPNLLKEKRKDGSSESRRDLKGSEGGDPKKDKSDS